MVNPSRTEWGFPSRTAPVHIGAGVSLVGVDDHILYVAGGIARSFPLGSRGKAAASPASQVGFLDFLQYLFRAHPGKGLGEGGITADGQIVVDALRIDFTVGTEDNPLLVLVEGDLRFMDDLFIAWRGRYRANALRPSSPLSSRR